MNRSLKITLLTFAIICIGVAIPLILNYLLLQRTPCGISIVGDEITWLEFWGAYLGGIFTAIIGFATIYWDNKRAKQQLKFSYKEKQIAELERTLSDCIATFDASKINKVALYLDEDEKQNMHVEPHFLRELDLYCETITKQVNAFNLIFNTHYKTSSASKKAFIDAYINCAKNFIEVISNLEKDIVIIEGKKYNNCQELIDDIISLTNNLKDNTAVQTLYDCAQDWLKHENTELDDLRIKIFGKSNEQ